MQLRMHSKQAIGKNRKQMHLLPRHIREASFFLIRKDDSQDKILCCFSIANVANNSTSFIMVALQEDSE